MKSAELKKNLELAIEAIQINRGLFEPDVLDKLEGIANQVQANAILKNTLSSFVGMTPDKIGSILTSFLQIIATERNFLDQDNDKKVVDKLTKLLNAPITLGIIARVI